MAVRKEIEFYWPYDQKMHTVKINTDNDSIDLDELIETINSFTKDNEEECKRIYYLGVALTGSIPGGNAFLKGWLARSLREGLESKSGKWKIQHDASEIPESQLRSWIAKSCREFAEWVENTENFKAQNAPILTGTGNDGTELFK